MLTRKPIRRTLTLLVTTVLAGCMASPFGAERLPQSFSQEAATYNEMAAKSANAQMLLNILRSVDRHPRRFSTITSIANDRTVQSQAALDPSFPFGGGADPTFSIGPTVSQTLTANPTVNIKILDSKEFMTGMMRPLPADQVSLLWETGWPKDVLLYTLASEIKIQGVRDPIPNSTWRNRQCTNDLLEEGYIAFENHFNSLPEYTDNSDSDGLSYEQFSGKFKEGYRNCIFRAIVRYLSEKNSDQYRDEFGATTKQCNRFAILPSNTFLTPADLASLKEAGLTFKDEFVIGFSGSNATPIVLCDGKRSKPDLGKFSATFRSVDQAIYHVGELIRDNQLNSGSLVKMYAAGEQNKIYAPLFVIHSSNEEEANFAAEVNYNGQTFYAGPAGEIGRTTTVMTLLDLLFQLNTSASELTGPQSVQIVGGGR